MMLRTLLPGIPLRYAFAGSAIGALLPLVIFSFEALEGPLKIGLSTHTLAIGLDNPAEMLVALMPIIFGLFFYRFGLQRERLLRELRLQRHRERLISDMALRDALTGLANRQALERDIATCIEARHRGRYRPAILLLDLDRFKHVNDTQGHAAGDELLRQFAQRLAQAFGRISTLYRLGGDEFVLLVRQNHDRAFLERLAGQVEALLEEPFELAHGRAIIGLSIGIAWLEPEDSSLADLIRKADTALYGAKEIVGSAHLFHDDAMARSVLGLMQMEQDIARGLADGDFFVEYQPIVTASARDVTGFEALVRWRHPSRGIIAPDEFIPIAERTGHIMALGRFVLERALADAAAWPDMIGVGVNVSGDEFSDPRYVIEVQHALDRHRIAPSRLTIEITESIFTLDPGIVRTVLQQLRQIGVRVALDDFGMGFSSLSHLRQFPIDSIKVDRSFTRGLIDDSRDMQLIDVIMRLGRAFGVPTIVEGVENEAQLERLRQMGANAIQGYLISRPIPASAVAPFVVRTDPSFGALSA